MNYKKIIYIVTALSFVGWAGYRIYVINTENNRVVFNSERDAEKNGLSVSTLTVHKRIDFLYEPLVVKNNIAYVSADRVSKFTIGQNVDNGIIVSISRNIDLDSGMHIIKTSGQTNGLHYAKIQRNGIFVPIDAISDSSVMVSENGIVSKRAIIISDQDSKQALVSSGLNEGDIVILSPVQIGRKIKW